MKSGSWFLPNGEQLLHNDDRIIIDSSEKNRSILTFKNLERGHSGNFKCVCKNSQGEDEHEIRVDVLAPPTKPTGPIEVSKVTPSGCHLMWTKPKDDGGSPINGYSIEKKDVEKDYWNPCGKISGKMATVMRELEFDITDLNENFVYVFRVMAFNAIGEGEPLMTPCPTIAKFELDPPNQPFNINIVDFDKKWVKLDWTIPSGPKATKYVVEKIETFLIPKDEEEEEEEAAEGEEGGQQMVAGVAVNYKPREAHGHQEYVEYSTGWMVAGTTEDEMPEMKLTDLQEGYRYQFRVKAVNKAGFWGRREIKNSSTVLIDSSDYASKCSVLNLERADTGTFSFRAENAHGNAECSIEVNVMVPPQKPRGPMRIDNITGEGCEASWNKPDDDGGSPVTYYVVEKAQGSGESWMPCGRATAPQTEVQVKGLTQDKDYRLRVIAVNAQGESEPLCCVDSFITENPFQKPGAPGRPELKDWDSDHFDMKWDAPRNDGGARIQGYELEARLWKDTNWFKAGEVKMQLEHGLVEGVDLGQGYAIRVRAKNAAGFSPWSIESEQVVCKFKALKPKVKIDSPKEIIAKEDDTVTVFADVPAEPACEDIKWSISGNDLVHEIKWSISG